MHKQQWSDQEFQDTFYTIQFAVTVTSFIYMKAETIKEKTSETLISDKTQLRNTTYESSIIQKSKLNWHAHTRMIQATKHAYTVHND